MNMVLRMTDIKSPKLLWAKGGLFLVLGFVAGFLAWQKTADWETAILLAITVWAFARAYYFAIYVIETYADLTFKYSGLYSLLTYVLASKRGSLAKPNKDDQEPCRLIGYRNSDFFC